MSKIKVGFICVHNSCRSQMAEAILNYYDENISLRYILEGQKQNHK